MIFDTNKNKASAVKNYKLAIAPNYFSLNMVDRNLSQNSKTFTQSHGEFQMEFGGYSAKIPCLPSTV